MKASLFLSALLLPLFFTAGSLSAQEATIRVSSVKHADGTRTDTQTDLEAQTSEAKTFGAGGNLLKRVFFKTDNAGKPLEGTVYDGNGKVQYRLRYTYDAQGRVTEEQDFDLKGTLLRRFVYRYGANGSVSGIETYDANGNLISGGNRKKSRRR